MLKRTLYICLVFLLLLSLAALCGCAAVPDFSEHVKYGITDYPGAAEGTTVYDYLRSVVTPEAATGSSYDHDFKDTTYYFDHTRTMELLKDAQIPNLDETDDYFRITFSPDRNQYHLTYETLRRQGVSIIYFEDGNFDKGVRLTPAGARHPKLLTFDSRDESVALLKP